MAKLFFALDLDNKAKNNIARWREKSITLAMEQGKFKLIPQQNFHITLCFLGEVTAVQSKILIQKAQQLAQKIKLNKNSLLLSTVGLFKKPKVLYLAPSPHKNDLTLKQLTNLANHLRCAALALDIYQEERPYLPHLSLFRKATFIPDLISPPASKLLIDSFSLYQSISTDSGVKYQAIKTWTLS